MKKICYSLVHKLFKNAWDLVSVKFILKEMGLLQERRLPGKEIIVLGLNCFLNTR